MNRERREWGQQLLDQVMDRSLPAEERATAEKEFWAAIDDFWEKDRAMWKALQAHIGAKDWNHSKHKDLVIAEAKRTLGYELNPWDRRVLEAAS